MNNEIKFKAWDCLNNVMKEWSYVKYNFDLEDLTSGRFYPLQFTGRTAKPNVDIYKGDIVKVKRTVDFIGEVKQLDGGQYYVAHKAVNLKYKHQIHCEICETESPLFFLDFFEPYELEVIGNIYENPELI